MSHYLVRAKPIPEKMEELRARIARGEIVKMIPFGRGLHNSLSDARWDAGGAGEAGGGRCGRNWTSAPRR
jgi:hypothetical protein